MGLGPGRMRAAAGGGSGGSGRRVCGSWRYLSGKWKLIVDNGSVRYGHITIDFRRSGQDVVDFRVLTYQASSGTDRGGH